jgi:large subunit ribosomal protein L10
MPMNRAQKATYLSDVTALASSSLSIVVMYYTGLSSKNMDEIRRKARNVGVFVKVSKNNLTRMAFAKTEYATIADDVTGHVLLMFSPNDPGAAAKLALELMKQFDFIKVCSIGLTGTKLPVSQLDQVASLPNREQALAMFMGTMLAPVRALATVMQETYAGLTRAMSQVTDQKSKH